MTLWEIFAVLTKYFNNKIGTAEKIVKHGETVKLLVESFTFENVKIN